MDEFTNIEKTHTQTAKPGTIQIFVPCGDRTHDTQRSSQSLSHCANGVIIFKDMQLLQRSVYGWMTGHAIKCFRL